MLEHYYVIILFRHLFSNKRGRKLLIANENYKENVANSLGKKNELLIHIFHNYCHNRLSINPKVVPYF